MKENNTSQPLPTPVEVERKGFSITFYEGSALAELTIKNDVVFDEALTRECRAILTGADPGKKYYLLVGCEGFCRVTKKARILGASRSFTAHLAAIACHTTSVSLVLLGELFLKINKPHIPVKLFPARELALEWLQQVMHDPSSLPVSTVLKPNKKKQGNARSQGKAPAK